MRLNDQNQIVWVRSDGPAMKAGLLIGDKIERVNDQQAPSCPELLETILDSPNKSLILQINRDASAKPVPLLLGEYKVKGSRNYVRELIKLVFCNQKINLVLLVTNVENNYTLPPGMDAEKWAMSKRIHIQNDWAQGLLEVFSKAPNFHLVEREAVADIFKELKFQISGAISPDTAKRLGQMYGASHLLLVEFARFPDTDNNFKDLFSSRLIEVETGRVLSVDQNAIDKDAKYIRVR
jgi:hypothetical protein